MEAFKVLLGFFSDGWNILYYLSTERVSRAIMSSILILSSLVVTADSGVVVLQLPQATCWGLGIGPPRACLMQLGFYQP